MKRESILMGVMLAALLVALNSLASRHFFRLDLTANREYTLSTTSKDLLRTLDDVVTVRVYFTKELPPQLLSIKQGVDDLLAEYKQYGGKNFVIEYRDPQDDPQTERELMMAGIAPLQVNVVEKDKQEVARVYLGMLMQHGDQVQNVPVDPRAPTRNLEEYLTGAIVKLTREKVPVIGWWAPSHLAEGNGFTLVHSLMSDRYTVKDIDQTKPELDPKALDGLVLIAPDALTAAQQTALDQYLGAGGKIIMLLSRVKVGDNFMGTAQTTGVEDLLKKYGVTVPATLVADATSEYAAFRSDFVTYQLPYPLWPSVRRDTFNHDDPLVNQLEALALPWVSPIDLDATLPDGVQATILATSSLRSQQTPNEPPYTLDPQSASLLVPKHEGRAYPLIVRVSDTKTAAEILLVSSAHFAEDRFVGQQQFREGVTFFSNLVDHFGIGDALAGIRSRPVTARPLAPDLSTARKLTLRYLNMLAVPAAFIAAGMIAYGMRRRRWQLLHAEMNTPRTPR